MTEEIENRLEKIELYSNEIDKDTYLNRLNLEDESLKMPAKKAKWSTRLIHNKKELHQLQDILSEALIKITEKIKLDSPVVITTQFAEKSAEQHEYIKKIKKNIRDQHLIVDYLEKAEKIMHNMNYDIQNIVNIIKQETS